jgi:hypothetical protein
MKRCFYVITGLVMLFVLGCMCMMPMGRMHKGHEHESHKQEISSLCQCDCVERGGECHCRHAS